MNDFITYLLSLFFKPKAEPIEKPKVKLRYEKRLNKELKTLKKKNPELYEMAIDFTAYVREEFDKDVVLTCILRSDAEQLSIYRGMKNSKGVRFEDKPWKSPHQFWHALDLRSKIYTYQERKKMVKWWNERGSKDDNYYKWTAKVHKVGEGALHFHVQFVKKI